MRRFGWGSVIGVGVAGLLVAAPSVRATDDPSKGSSSSSSSSSGGLSGHDTAAGSEKGSTGSGSSSGGHHGSMSSDSPSGHHGSASSGSSSSDQTATGTGSGAASSGSEARGSGQAGESTGARPGEVTGAGGSGGTSEREAKKAAEGTNQLWGTVEKFDRENRTLSLEDSDKKLKVTDDTQIMKDGSRVSPGQIMEGDEVRASYSGSGDSEVLEATSIEVVPASPEKGTGAGSSGALPTPPTGGGDKASGSSGSSTDVGSGASGTKSPQQ